VELLVAWLLKPSVVMKVSLCETVDHIFKVPHAADGNLPGAKKKLINN
jgi:hypothetical protein